MSNVVTLAKPVAVKAKYVPLVLSEVTLKTRTMKRMKSRLRELLEMLEYCRPDDSAAEIEFISNYIDTLPHVQVDGFGNRIIQVGKGKPNVCWASHTDTVHYDSGKQALEINALGDLCLDYHSEANCLGADCTAGVWLMRRMILAGKKGLYIFHRSEESGGQGSTYIANSNPELLEGIEFLISLDRKGLTSIITEQYAGITASRAFAASIAPMLPAGMSFDPTGTFTDSQNYSHLVSECSNLSIGYEHCHTARETLDYMFLDNLLEHLLKLDYSKLKASRVPTAQDDWYQGANDGPYGYYQNYNEYMDYGTSSTTEPSTKRTNSNGTNSNLLYDCDLARLVRSHPEATALLLGERGLDVDDLYDYIRLVEEQGQ